MLNPRVILSTAVAVPFLLASAVSAGDRSVENFLVKCPGVAARLDSGFAPSLSFDTWQVTAGDDRGSSDRRPEEVEAGQYPRVLVEKLEAGDLEAKGLLAQDRDSGKLWAAWIGLSDGCLVLEGTATELEGAGGKLTTSADGKERALTVGTHRLVLELNEDEMAADPDDIADCYACTESDECQSNSCAGPEGGKLCRPASGEACPSS